jgi:hypothetical protein
MGKQQRFFSNEDTHTRVGIASSEDGETCPQRLPNYQPNEGLSYVFFHVVWQSLWLLKYLKVKSRWSVSR